MRLKNVVAKMSYRHTGDILSAIWHWMLFLGLKGFSGIIKIRFEGGRVSGLMENGEPVELDVRAINKKIRLGKCRSEQQANVEEEH